MIFACDYGSFQKFADFVFPRAVKCYEDKHRVLSVQVTSLSAEQLPDPELFKVPAGAVERAECMGSALPPKAISTPSPGTFRKDANAVATVSLLIDNDGKPQELKIIHSAGKDLDALALSAVKHWKFKPATCDGAPMPVEISVQVDIRTIP